MTHGSSFSGIGGFDLAAEWVGWQNLFNCEIDPFCQTVLKHHFPDAEQFTDIRTADFARYKGRIDVFTGGFPCQPFSTAGKQKGTEDDRYLWPEMLGVIRVIRPRWVVGENVYGIVSWSDGLVFEQVCADLEAEGYEVQPYVLPACGVGAPHQRYRTWFVAKNTECVRCDGIKSEKESEVRGFGQSGAGNHVRVRDGAKVVENSDSLGCCGQGVLCQQPGRAATIGTGTTRIPGLREELANDVTNCPDAGIEDVRERKDKVLSGGDVADTQCLGSGQVRQNIQSGQSNGKRIDGVSGERDDSYAESRGLSIAGETRYRRTRFADYDSIPNWRNFPTQSPVRRGDDGLSDWLDFDAVFEGIPTPRRIKKAYNRWREQAIKAYGNAVVPQVVLQIFETINEYETLSRAERSGK